MKGIIYMLSTRKPDTTEIEEINRGRHKEKVVFFTGATDGIGKMAAKKIARLGVKLYIAGRNYEKTKKVTEELIESTGNKNIHFFVADLSKQSDIKELFSDFSRAEERLDILINNAAVFGYPERTLTTDGVEINFAVNYLATYMITNLFFDHLRRAKNSKILNVVSGAYISSNFLVDNYNADNDYVYTKQYAFSKLCSIMFSVAFSKGIKNGGPTINCLHPGFVRTGIISKNVDFLYRAKLEFYHLLFSRPVSESSDDYVRLCFSKKLDDVNGQYFHDGVLSSLSELVHDEKNAHALLELSRRITGIPLAIEL